MSVDSRSIDFANSASIDMMALNNKVVNMRQVVKRTKVQVINKLCKNIAALKKKKGTEEQRTQNLRKAERLIEEIDSIKRLKEDKVSKYSLANTASFTDVCKTSLSAGPRAMARLADHSLMQKVVGDFRTQHPDWRDLAAYLLVKQTGRRFKTKKQKQGKKLSRSVENIQASETMTKAYIQERFGKEGLKKAEQRFERKRKRTQAKEDPQAEKQEEDDNSQLTSKEKRETGADSEDEEKTGDVVELDVKKDSDDNTSDTENVAQIKRIKKEDMSTKIVRSQTSITKIEPELIKPEESEENSVITSQVSKIESGKSKSKQSELSKELKTEPEETIIENSEISGSDSDSGSSDENIDDSQDLSQQAVVDTSSKKKNECVVKEIDMDETAGVSFDKEADSEEEESNTGSGSSSDDDDDLSQSKPAVSKRQKKKAELKNKRVPVMLTNKPDKAFSDPFFVGTDDEEEDDDAPNDFDEALWAEPGDDEFAESSAKGNKSLFYNPQGDEIYRRGVRVPTRGWSNSRGGGRWQRQDRGRDWDRRGRTAGPQRGRGMSLGGPKTRGAFGGGHSLSHQSFGGSRFDNTEKVRHNNASSTSATPGTSEKLHPSWEASKKRKAEQSGIQAFKGSKITFGDDD